MATYDPYKLIDQVRELLHASGVDPVIVSEKDALVQPLVSSLLVADVGDCYFW
jgi:hypothetical protein